MWEFRPRAKSLNLTETSYRFYEIDRTASQFHLEELFANLDMFFSIFFKTFLSLKNITLNLLVLKNWKAISNKKKIDQ